MEGASKEIQEALEYYLESCIEDNMPIPEPQEIQNANGRIAVRTSKATHLKLLKLSKKEGVFNLSSCDDAIIKQYG